MDSHRCPRPRSSQFFGFLLAALSSAATLAGQARNDLRVALTPSFPASTLVKAGFPVTYEIEVRNDGPDEAFNIQVTNRLPVALTGLAHDCHQGVDPAGSVHMLTCNIFRLPPGESVFFGATFLAPSSSGTLPMDARVGTTGFPDPNPSNNTASLVYSVTEQPDLVLDFSVPLSLRVEPGTPVEYHFALENRSLSPATAVRFQFQLPQGFTFESAGFGDAGTCEEHGGLVTCTAARIPGTVAGGIAPSFPVTIQAHAPASARGGFFPLAASVTSSAPDYDTSDNTATVSVQVYRHYQVTSVLDSGPGSLRASIDAANAECDRDQVPCRIDFAIPGPPPANGWFTIQPFSPLPPILPSDLTIDGATQIATTGDTNPFGPKIELNGERCARGSGLEIRSRGESLVAGLAINGFPENGILVTGPSQALTLYGVERVIRDNSIGTDPTGRRAIPNGLRGIACFAADSGKIDIRDNVVSGNGRSGIFLAAGGPFAIERNRIGTDAAGQAALPNGASGIYVGNGADCVSVQDNVIAFNHDIGVGSEYSRNVAIQRNSISANGLSGIDFGLDGETTGPSFDSEGVLRAVAPPVLESARFDTATGTIVIQGHFGDFVLSAVADLYAGASSDGQGEKWLGQATNDGNHFVLSYPGNLAGQSITATATLNFFQGFAPRNAEVVSCGGGLVHTTSEFSRPIPVTQSASSGR